MNRTHLTSEDLDIALFGTPSAFTTEHLATCIECKGELSSLRAGFGDLRLATNALAAEDLRALDPTGAKRRDLLLPRAQRAFFTMPAFTMPRLAIASAVLAFAIGTPVALHHRTINPVAVAPAQTTPQISDEALLTSIQSDLSSSVPAPLLPLASTTSTTETQKED